MSKLDRRQFLAAAAATAVVTTFGPRAALAARSWTANLGKVGDLDSGEPIEVFAQFKDEDGKVMDDEKVYVRAVKNGSAIDWVVLSAICTHLKCKIKYDGANSQFKCPCHKSTFSLDGQVTKKPAKKDLPDYSSQVSEEDGCVFLTRQAK